MSDSTSEQKRQRAAAFAPTVATAPIKGTLDVQWGSPFDRLCYHVSAEGMPVKHRNRYDALMKELTAGTGCTEEELIAHGLKVRATLYFVEQRLGREGTLASLVGKEQLSFALPPVLPVF